MVKHVVVIEVRSGFFSKPERVVLEAQSDDELHGGVHWLLAHSVAKEGEKLFKNFMKVQRKFEKEAREKIKRRDG